MKSQPELWQRALRRGSICWRVKTRSWPTSTLAESRGAQPQQQTELLDLISYRKNGTGELGPGVRFFEWVRKMVVDGFYSSPLGTKDLGYMGNTAVSKFEVPQAAIDYALQRSPFGK